MDGEGKSREPPYGIAPSGYRLPGPSRPGRVRLQVAELGRSLAYYERVLGMRVLTRSATGASLGAEGGDAPLVELEEEPGIAPAPRRGRLGLFHYAILLPDRASLGRFLAHLRDKGVAMGASNHRVSEALYLQDPDGLGIEVYADRPRSTWRHERGELVMVTEPLDQDSLLREAGDAPWAGMPADTTMGHIHLHVGDLTRAESFYHQALGLDKTVWSYPGALFLSAGGYHHHLGVNTWATSAVPAPEGEAHLLDWELLLPSVEDAEGVLDNLTRAGHPVERTETGGTVRDPWGTGLRIRGMG